MKLKFYWRCYRTKKIPTVHYKLMVFGLAGILTASCRSTYPCPDIHGETEVVKEGSSTGLKKAKPDWDENGRLVKKPYSHNKMKKKQRQS